MLRVDHANIITWGPSPAVYEDHALLAQDGRVVALGPTLILQEQFPDVDAQDVWDVGGQWVLPGNICAHTHFYGAYARGMAVMGPPPPDFPAVLRQLWWPLDRALDRDAVRASARLMVLDAVRHGTTILFDHHASPNALEGSLDAIAAAVEEAGLRAVLCYEVTDRDGIAKAEAGLAENMRFLRERRNHPMVRGTVGLHASMTLSDATLRAVAQALPTDGGVHVHVAEHEADQHDSHAHYSVGVVQRLHHYGLLGGRSIMAHGVHLSDDEHALLADTGTFLTHQPRSNMNNGVGAMPWAALHARGVHVGVGTDGLTHNMFDEWKAAYLLHKLATRDPRAANGQQVVDAATRTNAALAETYFPGLHAGTIAVGAAADWVVVDYAPFTPLTAGNAPWHVLFGVEASIITGTVCAGRVLMRDRHLHTLDATSIVDEARALAPAVWARYAQQAAQNLTR